MKNNEKQEKIIILGKEYYVEEVIDHITVADSFVLKNKIGIGHGEAKLYIGPRAKEDAYRGFFNNFKNIQCFFIKQDLEGYLDSASFEYEEQERGYISNISEYYIPNKQEVSKLNPLEYFDISESNAGGPSRFYLSNSEAKIYKLFRTIALPEITYLSILKLINLEDNKIYFYFRPFLDYFYDKRNTVDRINAAVKEINNIEKSNVSKEEKEILKASRTGQGKYRQLILEEFPAGCIITNINDDRLLIASHIKPWIDSNEEEKISRFNGLLLSPTFDRLFDQGFITFQNDGTVNTSPYISPMNWRKIGLQNDKKFELKREGKREEFLEYHRTKIFKGVPE